MNKLFVLALLLGSVAKADSMGLTVGMGPTGQNQSFKSSSSSSSSTTTGHGHSENNTTTNITNNYYSSQTLDMPIGRVVGIYYMHNVERSPLQVGVLLQTNQTYSVTFGFDLN